MVNDFFKYCPACGSRELCDIDDRKWVCKACGFTLYNNVAAAVALIIPDEKNNIVFEIRAKEPKKGLLAIPGGFCNPDESAEQAAFRECKEEIGIEPVSLKYLCSFPNTYFYKNIQYKTCDLFFTARIKSEDAESLISQKNLQETEVSGLLSKSVKTKNDIQKLPIAFDSTRKALRVWLQETTPEI